MAGPSPYTGPCQDSHPDDLHPAASGHFTCGWHRSQRRSHASRKSQARRRGDDVDTGDWTYTPPARPDHVQAAHPAVRPAAPDDVVLVIPRAVLDTARAAMTGEDEARTAWRRASAADRAALGDALAAAALRLSQAIDPIVYALRTPDPP